MEISIPDMQIDEYWTHLVMQINRKYQLGSTYITLSSIQGHWLQKKSVIFSPTLTANARLCTYFFALGIRWMRIVAAAVVVKRHTVQRHVRTSERGGLKREKRSSIDAEENRKSARIRISALRRRRRSEVVDREQCVRRPFAHLRCGIIEKISYVQRTILSST